MKISKEELKNLAEQLQIELNDNELDNINESIINITDKLDEILKVDTEGEKPTISNVDVPYNKDREIYDEEIDQMVNMTKINNFDGEFVTIKKGENE